MKIFTVIFLALTLISCGGGSSTLENQTPAFSQEELNNTILVSKDLLKDDFNSLESVGSIILFNSTSIMREFTLTKEAERLYLIESAEYAEQPWTVLTDGRIQITYPQGVTCYTKKENETDSEINLSGECTNNLEINETVLKPLAFDFSVLQGKKITTLFEGTREVFDFKDNGTFDLTTDNFGDEVFPQGSGTFEQSDYKNAIRINHPGIGDYDGYSLLFLVEGDLSDGKLVEIRYRANEVLDIVRIHTVADNNTWQVNNWFINWEIRGQF